MTAGMRRRGLAIWWMTALLLFVAMDAGAQVRRWQPIARDGVHDPKGPGIRQLQEPREALGVLPPDGAGNQVQWVEALERGVIQPRTNLKPETRFEVRDDAIILNRTGGLPMVRFPHRAHTLWLDCSNCHEQLFVSKAGANRLSMEKMLQGEQCGLCHGAVAFPLTECARCHSVAHDRKPAAGR